MKYLFRSNGVSNAVRRLDNSYVGEPMLLVIVLVACRVCGSWAYHGKWLDWRQYCVVCNTVFGNFFSSGSVVMAPS